jgi:hypothetical protein
MAEMPEFVYLITVDGEWPVSAIAADHISTPERIEREVERRGKGSSWGSQSRQRVHVWRVKVEYVQEVYLMPTTTVKASLREDPS